MHILGPISSSTAVQTFASRCFAPYIICLGSVSCTTSYAAMSNQWLMPSSHISLCRLWPLHFCWKNPTWDPANRPLFKMPHSSGMQCSQMCFSKGCTMLHVHDLCKNLVHPYISPGWSVISCFPAMVPRYRLESIANIQLFLDSSTLPNMRV